MRAALLIAVVAALGAVAAAPAGANTLTYSGTTATTDNTNDLLPFDESGPTTCAAAPTSDFGGGPVPYRKYAFRNASPSSDCITVSGNSNCTEGRRST